MSKLSNDIIIKVGMADLNTVRPPAKIRTSGLGSCVGVVIYDTTTKIAGMAHVMLPDSSIAKSGHTNEAKYANTAIMALLEKMKKEGARTRFLKAKLAGGAQMFKFSSQNEMMRVGPRNVEAVKKKLRELGIDIVAEDTGGSSGRTIEFNPETFELHLRTVNHGEKVL